ncbi:MAG: GC-type dockerin domain-anchored protein [Phycisphaerales bacterium]
MLKKGTTMRFVFIAAALVALPAAALGQVHAGDIILKYDGTRIIVGRVEGGQIVYGARVVSGAFGDIGIPSATFNPGYDSEAGAFPPQQIVGLTVRRALRVWDGQDFDEVPEEQLRLTKQQNTAETPPGDPPTCQVAGSLPLGLSSSSGKLHQHPAYELLAPADPGVYLLELEAWMGAAGSAVSLPFWIVFSQEASLAEVEAAFEYAEQILTCPADFNRDGLLTVSDFGAFQTGYVVQNPRADFNRDCAWTVADFGAFQTAFVLACP